MARRSRVRPLPPNSKMMIKFHRWKGVLPDKPMSGRWLWWSWPGITMTWMDGSEPMFGDEARSDFSVFLVQNGFDHFHRESTCPAACRRGARTQKVGGVAHCCSGCQALQREQNHWRLRRVLFRCRRRCRAFVSYTCLIPLGGGVGWGDGLGQ